MTAGLAAVVFAFRRLTDGCCAVLQYLRLGPASRLAQCKRKAGEIGHDVRSGGAELQRLHCQGAFEDGDCLLCFILLNTSPYSFAKVAADFR